MSITEKVFALLSTEEIFQINIALKLINKENLFSSKGLAEVCARVKVEDSFIPTAISNSINSINQEYWIYETNLEKIPEEIALFKNQIKIIKIENGESLRELPNSILKNGEIRINSY